MMNMVMLWLKSLNWPGPAMKSTLLPIRRRTLPWWVDIIYVHILHVECQREWLSIEMSVEIWLAFGYKLVLLVTQKLMKNFFLCGNLFLIYLGFNLVYNKLWYTTHLHSKRIAQLQPFNIVCRSSVLKFFSDVVSLSAASTLLNF